MHAVRTILIFLAAFGAVLFGTMNNSYAQSFSTNAQLLASCKTDAQSDFAQCMSYMRGAVKRVNGMARAQSWTNFCPPKEITDKLLQQIIIDYLEKDLEASRFPPEANSGEALLKAWQCKK